MKIIDDVSEAGMLKAIDNCKSNKDLLALVIELEELNNKGGVLDCIIDSFWLDFTVTLGKKHFEIGESNVS